MTIFTNETSNVLAVTTKALKFTPNEKMLTEEQSIQDCQGKDKVWILEGNVFKAIAVKTGTSNGTLTEIISGLKAGQKVITEFKIGASDEDEGEGANNNNPFMPKHPSKNKDKKG